MPALKVVHSAVLVNASVLHGPLHAARVVHQMTAGLAPDAVAIAVGVAAAHTDSSKRQQILHGLRGMGIDIITVCQTWAVLDRNANASTGKLRA